MNILEAKNEIIHTLRAYLQKDEVGNYCFPTVHQRPILLMGPPGIGKTAILEQIARECGVGLVAYTITHHTRQSAIGLPHIEQRVYAGIPMSVTEYTMSEIIATVYETMERTGKKEGILFLDEINCVSETLAPTMLQFLQNKTFGSHKVPEGWIIVAAGNPPQYNKSVREFDVVTLDRVRQIDVEADLTVWLDYAREKQLHGAVVSYLTVKPDRFYTMEQKDGALSFVTARGWEDLSQILKAYESLEVPVTEALVSQYLHQEATTRDFTSYYRLYQKYGVDYGIADILSGTISGGEYREKTAMASGGSFDERVTVVNLILERLQAEFQEYHWTDAVVTLLHSSLRRFRGFSQMFSEFVDANRSSLDVKLQNALLTQEEARQETWVLHRLEEMETSVKERRLKEPDAQLAHLKGMFSEDLARRTQIIGKIQKELENAFRFVADSFGDGQEMILLVSSLTRTLNALEFIRCHGCAPYLKYAQVLLYRQQEAVLQETCKTLL
ncbi:MAG: ATP-binding protein [Faecousia sp.]